MAQLKDNRKLKRLQSFERLLTRASQDLTELLLHEDIKCLRVWLSTGTGLSKVRFGLSPSSLTLSVTGRLTSAPQPKATSIDLEQLEQFFQCMLGLLPEADISVINEGSSAEELQANRCLQEFTAATGVGVVGIAWASKPYGKQVKLRLCAESALNDRLSGLTPFRFSRSYIHNDKPALAATIVQEVWRGAATRRYIVGAEMKRALSSVLQDYIVSGVDGLSEQFKPRVASPIGVYLEGTAGVGKSSFISVFARSFSEALQRYLTPRIDVDVVKIPLNSGSPATLTQILRVKGISDWSVERMLEQSLVKGNLCILHLEELPQEGETQTRMLDLVRATVDHLLSKYPERSGNVFYLVTSNYDPDPSLCDKYTVINVLPPSWDEQKAWAKAMLEHSLTEKLCIPIDLQVDDEVFPQYTPDMRPLNNWWLTLSYALHSCCASESSDACAPEDPLVCRVYASDGMVLVSCEWSNSSQLIVGEPLKSSDSFFYFRQSAAMLTEVFEMCYRSFLKPTVVHSTDPEETRNTLMKWGSTCKAHICLKDITLLAQDDRDKIFGK